MPTIQTYSAKQNLIGSTFNTRKATADDFNGTARTLAAVSSLSSDVSNLIIEEERNNQEAALAKDISQFNLNWANEEAKLLQEHGTKPDYAELATKRAEEMLSQIPRGGYVADKYDIAYDKLKTSIGINAVNKQVELAGKQRLVDANQTVVNGTNAVRLNPATSFNVAIANVGDVAKTLPPGMQATFIADSTQDIKYARAEGIADRTPQQFLNAYKNGNYNDVDKIDNIAYRAEQKLKVQQSELTHIVNSDLTKAKEAASFKGMGLPQSSTDELIRKANLTGDKVLIAETKDFAENQEKLVMFSRLGLKDQKEVVDTITNRISEGSLDEVSKGKALISSYNQKMAMLKSDPYSYYTNLPENSHLKPNPISFKNSEEVAKEVDRRKPLIDQAKRDGIILPVFTTTEIATIKKTFDEEDIRKPTALLDSLRSLSRTERSTVSKLFNDANAPIVAAAISLDPEVAKDVLSGSRQKLQIKDDTIGRNVTGLLSKYGITNPAVLNQMTSSITSYYKQGVVRRGELDTTTVKTNDIEKAIEAVMGETISFTAGGWFDSASPSKIFSFRKENGEFASSGDIIDALKEIEVNDMVVYAGGIPLAANNEAITIRNLQQDAQMVSAGEGMYEFRLNNSGVSQVVLRQDGKPFRFNMKAYLRDKYK